jgi:hypothetical protein
LTDGRSWTIAKRSTTADAFVFSGRVVKTGVIFAEHHCEESPMLGGKAKMATAHYNHATILSNIRGGSLPNSWICSQNLAEGSLHPFSRLFIVFDAIDWTMSRSISHSIRDRSPKAVRRLDFLLPADIRLSVSLICHPSGGRRQHVQFCVVQSSRPFFSFSLHFVHAPPGLVRPDLFRN